MTDQRGAATVVARSADGERLTTVAMLDKARFGAESMERPALVRTATGRWRLYVCSATPESKHWWIDVLEADDPAGLGRRRGPDRLRWRRPHRRQGPVVRLARRPLARLDLLPPARPAGRGGPHDHRVRDQRGRSGLGLARHRAGPPARDLGRPRGQGHRRPRPTAGPAYDGRASKEENFSERTGLAHATGRPGELVQDGHEPVSDARYLDVVPLPDGGYRLYYEFPLPDESHELRTELIPAAT